MKMQRRPQAAEFLGKSELVIITERGDDGAFLIGQMSTMGLPEVLDRHSPRPWTQRGRSWGWTAVMWLAYIVTEGDHRRVSVETYLKGVVFQKWRWTAIAVTLGLVFVASMRKEWSMTFIAVRCPHCQSDQIVKRGKTRRGTQRYLCQNTLCAKGS